MKRKMLAIFLICAGVTAGGLSSSDANAKWRRFNGNSCTTDGVLWYLYEGLSNWGNQTVMATCDIGDDSYFAKTEMQGMNVHVYDGHPNGAVYASLCTSSWTGWYGSCGPWASSGIGFTGHATLQPSLSKMSSAADFGTLRISLPPSTGLKGFFTYD
jgi:hypothetical protein